MWVRKIKQALGLKVKHRIITDSFYAFNESVYELTPDNPVSSKPVVIVSRPQTFYISNVFAKYLYEYGLPVIVTGKIRPEFVQHKHIVFCPQSHGKDLALLSDFICYQTEQATNEKWFQSEHLECLNKADFILDYSEKNIEILKEKGLDGAKFECLSILYAPKYIDFLSKSGLVHGDLFKKEYDVVFYGDPNNERRRRYLKELNKHFKVKLICGFYGQDLVKELSKAKVVLNIHYFEDALLETGRVYEALSLGCHVVSETSVDQDKHSHLNGIVDFCEVDDVNAMVKAVQQALDNSDYIEQCKKNLSAAKIENTYNVKIKDILVRFCV